MEFCAGTATALGVVVANQPLVVRHTNARRVQVITPSVAAVSIFTAGPIGLDTLATATGWIAPTRTIASGAHCIACATREGPLRAWHTCQSVRAGTPRRTERATTFAIRLRTGIARHRTALSTGTAARATITANLPARAAQSIGRRRTRTVVLRRAAQLFAHALAVAASIVTAFGHANRAALGPAGGPGRTRACRPIPCLRARALHRFRRRGRPSRGLS